MSERMFPVLQPPPGCPGKVPWSLLAPFEHNALKVHDQTLERLAQRGGLSVSEMVAVVDGTGYDGACRPEAKMLPRLLELLAAHIEDDRASLRAHLEALYEHAACVSAGEAELREELVAAEAALASSVRREDVVRWLEAWERSVVVRMDSDRVLRLTLRRVIECLRDGSWLRDLTTMDARPACDCGEECSGRCAAATMDARPAEADEER